MLKDMKTSIKLACGFGAVMAILAALGVIAFVMFSRVDGNMTELGAHSLPAVKHAASAQCAALDAIIAEKNYAIYKKDEFQDTAKAKMSELVAALDAVDKVAEKFNDKELARKSKDLRGLAAQFEKLFDEYVAACKQNKAASDRLSVKGSAAADELAACLAAKKAEHQEAKEALAIANRIMAHHLADAIRPPEGQVRQERTALGKDEEEHGGDDERVRSVGGDAPGPSRAKPN